MKRTESQQEGRQERRIPHDKRVLLIFSPTLGFVGHTIDISRSGAFVHTPYPPEGVNANDQGQFKLISNQDKYNYSFTVIRCTDRGIAICFEQPPDNFIVNMLREI